MGYLRSVPGKHNPSLTFLAWMGGMKGIEDAGDI